MPKVRSQPPTTKSSTFYLVQLFSWPTISIIIGCPNSNSELFFSLLILDIDYTLSRYEFRALRYLTLLNIYNFPYNYFDLFL